jgi:pseudaminic acid biosynthesis-associated methylase
MKYTPQENFWKGSFGKDYTIRNDNKKIIKNNIFFFKKIFHNSNFNIKNIIEFGPNIGLNILAIKKIFNLNFITGVEINSLACLKLSKIKNVEVVKSSVLKFIPKKKYDLVLVKGLLIHINPKQLKNFYEIIYQSCKNNGYILFAEYYSPRPVKLNYRGKKDKLFKRDFAGEFISTFKNIKIKSYGFVYHKDKYPQDDLNWFLMKKK